MSATSREVKAEAAVTAAERVVGTLGQRLTEYDRGGLEAARRFGGEAVGRRVDAVLEADRRLGRRSRKRGRS